MYKISVFLILLMMGLILKKVDATVEKQVAAAPVIVQAQHKEVSRPRARKKHVLTSEQFKENVEDKVKKLKASKDALMPLSGKVESDEKNWFELFIRCADKWTEALKSYQSPDTNIYRSDRLAHKELRAAKALTNLKPTHHQAKAVYPQKDIDKLEARLNEVKAHADKLEGDNRKAFDAMVYCAGEYLTALKATKEKPTPVRPPLSQAMNYVNTAETFLHNRVHVPHSK